MSSDDDGIPVDVSTGHDSSGVIGRIGNYIIDAKLGQGGFGAVFRAHHAETENVVALKLLRADIAQRLPDVVLRFQREAKASNKINHRGIAKVLDSGTVDGQCFLTMEYLDGVALDSEIKRNGAMPPKRAIPILMQIADALGAAHAKGYVHRDVKPPNVFLIDDPHPDFVKVLDFGIAKILTPDDDDPLHTGTNAMMGSPASMAPEQWKGSKIDHRADIYALGIVAFYVLSGHYPFSGTQGELIAKHQLLPPPKVSEILSNSTPQLDAVIDRALAKKPEDRYQTMEEFHDALAACANDVGAQTVARAPRNTAPKTPAPAMASLPTPTVNGESRSAGATRSKSGVIVGVGVAVLALAAGGTYLVVRSHGDTSSQKTPSTAVAPTEQPKAPSNPKAGALGRARVTSVPAGATVSVGEKVLGTTPLDVDGKPGERIRLHFVHDQFEPADEEVLLEDPPGSTEVELRALATSEPVGPASKHHSHHSKAQAPAAVAPAAPPSAPAPAPAVKKRGSEDTTANPFEGN